MGRDRGAGRGPRKGPEIRLSMGPVAALSPAALDPDMRRNLVLAGYHGAVPACVPNRSYRCLSRQEGARDETRRSSHPDRCNDRRSERPGRAGGVHLRRRGTARRGHRQGRRSLGSAARRRQPDAALRQLPVRTRAPSATAAIRIAGTGRSVHPRGRGAGLRATAAPVQLDAAAPAARRFTLEIGTFGSIVTVSETGGFVAASSTSATKSDAPLIEIPQSVSVITLDQMTARNVQTVSAAISYTASVDVNTFGTETRFDWINIRGFDQSTYGLFRDNSRWQSGQVSGQIDPYMLQEIDVVKGPSSVLYGQNTPGGLVNLVTKRPPSQQLHEVVLNYGSHDKIQAQADLGGPIDDDGHRKYRLTGLPRQSDTQVDYVPDDRWFIAPALTWTPSDKTTLTLLADFQHDNTGWSQFLPSQGTFIGNPNGEIDRSLFVGEPDYDYFDRDQWSMGSLFEYQINDKLDAAQHAALLEHRVRRQDRLRRRIAGRPPLPQPLRLRQHVRAHDLHHGHQRLRPVRYRQRRALAPLRCRLFDFRVEDRQRLLLRRAARCLRSGLRLGRPRSIHLRQRQPADRSARSLRPGPDEVRRRAGSRRWLCAKTRPTSPPRTSSPTPRSTRVTTP